MTLNPLKAAWDAVSWPARKLAPLFAPGPALIGFLGATFAMAAVANPGVGVAGMLKAWVAPVMHNPLGPEGFITGFKKFGQAVLAKNWGLG